MDQDFRQPLAVTPDIREAAMIPTVIDAEELEAARLDEQWREFCMRAEHYVAAYTRTHRPTAAEHPLAL